MTIYITPFQIDTLQATADSQDSGFPSISSAIDGMGADPVRQSDRMSVFHIGPNEGLFFSNYAVRGVANGNG